MAETITPLDKLDLLSRDERTAFLAFFAGARSDLMVFVDAATNTELAPSFGKAECNWVPFREFWQHKLPSIGFTTFHEGDPRPALGMVAGSTCTDIVIKVTDDGHAAREAYWGRLDRRAALSETEGG